MNIIFFGTPDFAVPSLKILHESGHNVLAVVTAPDKERGRGRQVSFTPVKSFAVENGIEVLQPESLKDSVFIDQLRSYNADVFIIVAFRILPAEVFTLPKSGSFNLHGSLLPKYRGAAPIQWALFNGDKETGVTTFFLKEKVDTGNIIASKFLLINEEDDFGTLHDKMSALGAELVFETTNLIDSGEVKTIEQNDSLASPAPKIKKEMCRIDWQISASEIHNKVRGLSPFPGAYFEHKEKSYKIYKTKLSSQISLKVSEIKVDAEKLYFGTGNGTIEILEIQPEGRKRMTSAEFLRGYKL